MAHVGEELRLDLVELPDALEQSLQLDVLTRDLGFLRFAPIKPAEGAMFTARGRAGRDQGSSGSTR